MKHWVKTLFVLLLFSLIFLPKNIEARSGCCSGHGGVNCSAGAQSNGHVICNDGTRTSSCLYSEMVMCGGNSSSTTTITTVKTVQTISTPRPTLIPTKIPTVVPTKTPTTIPTNTPTPKLIPTSSPTETPTSIPTVEPTKTEELSPTSTQPQVLGETTTKQTEPVKTSDALLGLSFLGLIGFGIYKIFIKIKIKINNILNKK